jgi:predicted SAM-dependent methyltransferase
MTKAVLNVGGGSKDIPIPDRYGDWRQDLLDIDPRSGADVCHDARRLSDLPPATHHAVYCSHNLEHYYRHEAIQVARGFAHVLTGEGFAEVVVPDLLSLMETVVKKGIGRRRYALHIAGRADSGS